MAHAAPQGLWLESQRKLRWVRPWTRSACTAWGPLMIGRDSHPCALPTPGRGHAGWPPGRRPQRLAFEGLGFQHRIVQEERLVACIISKLTILWLAVEALTDMAMQCHLGNRHWCSCVLEVHGPYLLRCVVMRRLRRLRLDYLQGPVQGPAVLQIWPAAADGVLSAL